MKALAHLKKSDPVMAEIIQRVGPYRIQYRDPVFETLVRSIVFQQLSTKAAATIFGRFAQALGGEVAPHPILALTDEQFQSFGISRQKRAYIRDLAARTASGEVDFEACAALPDEQVIDHLTVVKGVGVWTVHMFLVFALRRPDVLPVGDLGIRTAVQRAYGLPSSPAPPELERLAEPWRPYRSVACWYLWRSLENPAQI